MEDEKRTIVPRPPLGLLPRWVWAVDNRRARVSEIINAISRYVNDNPPKLVPEEWVDELKELTTNPLPVRDHPPFPGKPGEWPGHKEGD